MTGAVKEWIEMMQASTVSPILPNADVEQATVEQVIVPRKRASKKAQTALSWAAANPDKVHLPYRDLAEQIFTDTGIDLTQTTVRNVYIEAGIREPE